MLDVLVSKLPLSSEWSSYRFCVTMPSRTSKIGLHLGLIPRSSDSTGCWIFAGMGATTGTKRFLLKRALYLPTLYPTTSSPTIVLDVAKLPLGSEWPSCKLRRPLLPKRTSWVFILDSFLGLPTTWILDLSRYNRHNGYQNNVAKSRTISQPLTGLSHMMILLCYP